MIGSPSDSDLLSLPEGFQILYNRHWKTLYKKAFSRLGNHEDAEDVVQEIFISLWRNKDSIEILNSVYPYLQAALKYAIIKKVYRKAKKGITLPLDVEELAEMELSSEDILEYKQLQQALADEIEKLPERMREIYLLSRMENLRISEIAAKLQISEQTVKNTLSTTLRRLKQRLLQFHCLLPFFL